MNDLKKNNSEKKNWRTILKMKMKKTTILEVTKLKNDKSVNEKEKKTVTSDKV